MGAVPEDVATLKQTGNEHLKAGKVDDARKAYTAALKLDPERKHPEHAAVLVNRALTQLKLAKHDECKADCTAALTLQPDYGKAYYRRALAHQATGNLADAFRDVRELMRLEPANKEAMQLAMKLKSAMEAKAAVSDLSTPTQAVTTLKSAASGSDEQMQAIGKLSRIAEGGERSPELLHSGAVEALVAVLPPLGTVNKASEVQMPHVGLAIEALNRMASKGHVPTLKAIAKEGETISRVLQIAKAAANAQAELGEEPAVVDISDGPRDEVKAAERVKNLLISARHAMVLLAGCAGCRSAVGSQTAQGQVLTSLLPFMRHKDESIAKCGQDCLVRVVADDEAGASTVLPEILRTVIWLLGDEESAGHRVAVGVLTKLFARQGEVDKKGKPVDDEGTNTKALCNVCEKVRRTPLPLVVLAAVLSCRADSLRPLHCSPHAPAPVPSSLRL